MKQNIIMQKQIGAIVIYIHASTRKVCTYMYKIYDVYMYLFLSLLLFVARQ